MATNTIVLISRRAKKIRKKNEPWRDAISRASKQISGTLGSSSTRSGATRKRGSVPLKKAAAKKKAAPKKRKKLHQTGGSDRAIDKRIKAKQPGKRTVKTGGSKHSYYEYRKNRTDMPGKLTGVQAGTAYRENILARLTSNNRQLNEAELTLQQLRAKYKTAGKADKVAARMAVQRQIAFVKSLKADIRMLSVLLKLR